MRKIERQLRAGADQPARTNNVSQEREHRPTFGQPHASISSNVTSGHIPATKAKATPQTVPTSRLIMGRRTVNKHPSDRGVLTSRSSKAVASKGAATGEKAYFGKASSVFSQRNAQPVSNPNTSLVQNIADLTVEEDPIAEAFISPEIYASRRVNLMRTDQKAKAEQAGAQRSGAVRTKGEPATAQKSSAPPKSGAQTLRAVSDSEYGQGTAFKLTMLPFNINDD